MRESDDSPLLSLAKELSELRQERDSLKSQLDAQRTKMHHFELAVQSLASDNKTLRQELSSLRKSHEESRATTNALEKISSCLNDQIES